MVAGTGIVYEDSCGCEEAVHVDGGKGGNAADGSGRGESCGEKRQRLIRKKNCLQISSGKRRKGVSVGGWFGLFIVYPSGWVRPPGPALRCLASVSVDIGSTHTLKAILHRGSLISMRFYFIVYIPPDLCHLRNRYERSKTT